MPPKESEFSEEYIAGSGQTRGAPSETPSDQSTEGKAGEPLYDVGKPRRIVVRAQIIND